jgi:Ca2+-transporting ATPase
MPTVLFTLFVVCQLCNALNSRELTGVSVFKHLTNNKLMLGVFLGTFILQVIITQWGGMFFGTVPLRLIMWVKIIGVGLSVVLLSEAIKLVMRCVGKK